MLNSDVKQRKKNLIDLKGRSMSSENLNTLLQATRSTHFDKNCEAKTNTEGQREMVEMESLLHSLFAINRDLKEVVKSNKGDGTQINGLFNKLRKDMYYLIKNLPIGSHSLNKADEGLQCLAKGKKSLELQNKSLLKKQMGKIKDGIRSIEKEKGLKFMENMINSIKSLENMVADREAVIVKFQELAEIMDKSSVETFSRIDIVSTRIKSLEAEMNCSKGFKGVESLESELKESMNNMKPEKRNFDIEMAPVNMRRGNNSLFENNEEECQLSEIRESKEFQWKPVNMEIKDNYSILKELDTNKPKDNKRSSLGPTAMSQYKKLVDRYSNMNIKKPKSKKKPIKKRQSMNVRPLTNLKIFEVEEKRQNRSLCMPGKLDFFGLQAKTFDKKEEGVQLNSFDQSKSDLLLMTQISEENWAKIELDELKENDVRNKKIINDLQVTITDLEIMNSNLRNTVKSFQDKEKDFKQEMSNIKMKKENMEEVMEELKTECYKLEKEVEQTQIRKSILDAKPKMSLSDIARQRTLSMLSAVEIDPIRKVSCCLLDRQKLRGLIKVETQRLHLVVKKNLLRGDFELDTSPFTPVEQEIQIAKFDKKEFLNQHETQMLREMSKINTKVVSKKILLNMTIEQKVKIRLREEKMRLAEDLGFPDALYKNEKFSSDEKSALRNICKFNTKVVAKGVLLNMKIHTKTKERFVNATFKSYIRMSVQDSISKDDEMNVAILNRELQRFSLGNNQKALFPPNSKKTEKKATHKKEVRPEPSSLTKFENEMITPYYLTLEDLLNGSIRNKLEFVATTEKPTSVKELKDKFQEMQDEMNTLIEENEFYKMNWPTEQDMQKGKEGNKKSSREELLLHIEQLKEQLKLKKQDFALVQEEVSALKFKNDEMLLENLNLKDLHEEQNKTLKSSQLKAGQLEYRVAEVEGEVEEMETYLEQLEKEAVSANKGVKTIKNDQDTLMDLEKCLEYKFSGKCENKDNLEMQNMEMMKELEAHKEEQEDTNNLLKAKISDMQVTVGELQVEKGIHEETIERLQIQQKSNEEADKKTTTVAKRMARMVSHRLQICQSKINKSERMICVVGALEDKLTEALSKFIAEKLKMKKDNQELQQEIEVMRRLRQRKQKANENSKRRESMSVDLQMDGGDFLALSGLSMSKRSSVSMNSRTGSICRSSNVSEESVNAAKYRELERKNKDLINRIRGGEDELKCIKDDLNALIFEKNEWEMEKKTLERQLNKQTRIKDEKEYFKQVKNTSHLDIKKENMELKRKLDRMLKLVNKNNSRESQIFGNTSMIRNSVMGSKLMSAPRRSMFRNELRFAKKSIPVNNDQFSIKEESQIRESGIGESGFGTLDMTILSKKNSFDSLNNSTNMELMDNINNIDDFMQESAIVSNSTDTHKKSKFVTNSILAENPANRQVRGSVLMKGFDLKRFSTINGPNTSVGNSFIVKDEANNNRQWFYLNFCEKFGINLSDFDRETIADYLNELLSVKNFYYNISNQVRKEFDLDLDDDDLRKFVIKKMKRFEPIDLFKDNVAMSTEKIGSQDKKVTSQAGDFSMSIEGNVEVSKMEQLVNIVNKLGEKNEQLEIQFQGLLIEKKQMDLQLEISEKEKGELLNDIQDLKQQNKQAIESSVFLIEKNIKVFIRKTLTRFLKLLVDDDRSDEFEMTLEMLIQSLEFSQIEKKTIYNILSYD